VILASFVAPRRPEVGCGEGIARDGSSRIKTGVERRMYNTVIICEGVVSEFEH